MCVGWPPTATLEPPRGAASDYSTLGNRAGGGPVPLWMLLDVAFATEEHGNVTPWDRSSAPSVLEFLSQCDSKKSKCELTREYV